MGMFDESTSRRVEALYRTADAARRRRAVLDALALAPGERVLDIGTGPGFLADEMADAVGAGGAVEGVDASEPMLALATARCAAKRWVRFAPGDATRLPVPDGAVDAAVSVQVFEYVPDVAGALREVYRALRPGGRAVVVSTDWRSIAWRSTDERRMARVLAAFAAHCAHQDLPRVLAAEVRAAGFAIARREVIPQFNPECEPSTYSHHLLGLVESFVAGRGDVTADEARAWADDLRRLGERGDYFFCLNQYLFLLTRPAAGAT